MFFEFFHYFVGKGGRNMGVWKQSNDSSTHKQDSLMLSPQVTLKLSVSDHSFRDGQREGCDGQMRPYRSILLMKGFAIIMLKFRDEIDPPDVTSYFCCHFRSKTVLTKETCRNLTCAKSDKIQ